MDVMADLPLLPGLLRATAGLGILEGFFLLGTLMDLCELSALADPTARTPSPAVSGRAPRHYCTIKAVSLG